MLSNDARILRGAALPAVPVGIVAAVLSAVLAGSKGLIGAVVAIAVVAVFFGLGFWALMRLTQNKPQLVMMAGLLVYAVQMLLIGVFIVAFKNQNWKLAMVAGLALGYAFDTRPLTAVAIGAAVLLLFTTRSARGRSWRPTSIPMRSGQRGKMRRLISPGR